MATCSFIKESKQTAGAMKGVMHYVSQGKKTLDKDGTRYLTGVNCVADVTYQSFMATKNLYGKANGTFFYQYVQSFSPQERIAPAEAHRIALELAEKFFPGCEVLVATHLDTEHLHSHFIINSVQPDTGRKLHFTPRTLERMRVVSDQIGTPTYTLDLARLLVDMIETDRYGYYYATNEGGYISWYDFACEIFRQAGKQVQVTPVTTAEYGLSKAVRPYNSRLDERTLVENGFTPLPPWQDALARYLKEIED